MRETLIELVQQVRAAGVPISVAESIDALRAAGVAGIEREPLREALAAALVKDEVDRSAFDDVFDRFFASGERVIRKRRTPSAAGETGLGKGGGEGEDRASKPRVESPEREGRRPRPMQPPRKESSSPEVRRRQRRRALLQRPFREMDPREAEELVALAAELGRRFRTRLGRRRRAGRRGRLDFRRTIRRSIARGGAPVDLVMRRRRPGRADLVVLCDLSGSVRHAAEFFAAVLAPADDFFRRVRFFAFVDRAVEASFESGRLVPHEAIDLHAFSDYGRMLVDLEAREAATFTRNTVVVVLGDARNNRRPPRTDALVRLRARSRTIWWLVPEAPSEWGRGDSAIESYRPSCDELLACSNGVELLAALARLAR